MDMTWSGCSATGAHNGLQTLYGGSFSDLCYGYIAFWKRCVPLLRAECPGFEVETVLNIKAFQNNLKIVEVPSFEYLRIHGESNLRAFPDGWRVVKALLREKSGASRVLSPAE